ncbi:hypothetical protein FOG18_05085 [Legionella israelensis]|uniref:hypothetical protein n=1 Tax=Legionella israelensis TaxID=454 RepID=UPI001180A53F|nr:hypothetical protein [Legionella israelensis]QDP71989.1 hypothetical protein FOG18_05085 [Legionella israelensis]
MGKNIVEHCGQLSNNEFRKSLLARWASASTYTIVNYTFNLASIPDHIKTSIYSHFGANVTISHLSSNSRNIVELILEKWQTACGNHIQFKGVENINLDEPGIVVSACDNLATAHGVMIPEYIYSLFNGITFHKAVVCLPSNITTVYDVHTVSHEFGHAIGLAHLHDISSITERLKMTPQGLGCSVMPYISLIQTTSNLCTTQEICDAGNFAVLPGPLDTEICTRLYDPSLSTRVDSPGTLYYEALLWGAVNGMAERFMRSFLSEIKFNEQNMMSNELARFISTTSISTLLLTCEKIHPALCLLLVSSELSTNIFNQNLRHYFQIVRTMVNTLGIMMSLMDLHESDSMYEKSVYLLAFLSMSLLSRMFSESLGAQAARKVSSLISKIHSYIFPSRHTPDGSPTASSHIPSTGTGHDADSYASPIHFFGSSAMNTSFNVAKNTIQGIRTVPEKITNWFCPYR